MDNKTVQEAISIIGLNKDKVTMRVKKEDGGTVSLPASRFAAPASRDHRQSESGKWLVKPFDCLHGRLRLSVLRLLTTTTSSSCFYD